MELIKRKLLLSKALKSLHQLIIASKEKTKKSRDSLQKTGSSWETTNQWDGSAGAVTVLPWWARRTNSHGRRRRRTQTNSS